MPHDTPHAGVPSVRHGRPQDYVTPPFLVAAVGASAGGLKAVSLLIEHVPENAPMSFVLAQHMSRKHPSWLPDILARRTALRVTFGQDAQRIEIGHVYVIPPGKHMTVIDRHLRLAPRPEGFWARQVDALFCSLAEYYRERAIGVVLSGALSDGSLGCHAIRAVGGLTFVQSPAEAQVDSMPLAAIAAGGGQILSAEAISRELLRLAESPRFRLSSGVAESP